MKDKICPKCGSSKVIPGVPIADRGHGNAISAWTAYITEKPRALFSRTDYFKIRAWICGECGYTELYVEDPSEVAKSYQRYMENVNRKKK